MSQFIPNVCILVESYLPIIGGMEAAAHGVAQSMCSHGSNVTIITRRSSDKLPTIEVLDGVQVKRIRPTGPGQFQRWKMMFTCIPSLYSMRKDYDIIFVAGFRALGLPAVIVGKLLGKRCVLKADNNGEMSGEFFAGGFSKIGLRLSSLPVRIFIFLRNIALRRADAFVSISSDISEELKSCGVIKSNIYSIVNPVDTKRFHPVSEIEKRNRRQALNLPVDGKIVIFTGRLVSWKGLPLLLRVWRELNTKFSDAHLVLVGAGSDDIYNCEDELRTFVKENNLGRSVIFTGSVDNVNEYLQASDIYVLPSENDALPVALIEAMITGLAVIATPISGIKDIVTDQETGLLVPVGDRDKLYFALCRMLSDSELCRQLAKEAHQFAVQKCSTEAVGEQYIKLFQTYHDGHGRSSVMS